MSDKRRAFVSAQGFLECQKVTGLVRDPVAVVRGEVGRGVASGKGRDCPPALIGQMGSQVPPGPGRVGVAMDEQGEGVGRIAQASAPKSIPRVRIVILSGSLTGPI